MGQGRIPLSNIVKVPLFSRNHNRWSVKEPAPPILPDFSLTYFFGWLATAQFSSGCVIMQSQNLRAELAKKGLNEEVGEWAERVFVLHRN